MPKEYIEAEQALWKSICEMKAIVTQLLTIQGRHPEDDKLWRYIEALHESLLEVLNA